MPTVTCSLPTCQKPCRLQKHTSFFEVWAPCLCTLPVGDWVPQFYVNLLIHMPIRKAGNEFTWMQLTGVRYCSLCIAYCTDIPLAGWRLLGGHWEGCSVLALAEVMMLVGWLLAAWNQVLTPGVFIPRHLWIVATFHAAFVLLSGWHLLCFKSLFEIPGYCLIWPMLLSSLRLSILGEWPQIV